MAPRRLLLGCVAAAALVAGAPACKGKEDAAKVKADLEVKCQLLAKTCGDTDKHIAKLLDECKQTPLDKCADKAMAMYDCYQKELCGKADKVWALDDLRVLADRNSKCVAERKAATECAPK
jgi:hypothetical protein